MKRFNLSEWAITHQALVLFMILLLGAAGLYSYFNLGRAEDPSFTIKTMIVNVAWPGATAAEMQTQVADKIEKKLQELPYLDRVESYSQPGVSFIQVFLTRQDAARQGEGPLVPGAQEGRRHQGRSACRHHRPEFQRRVRRRLFRHLHADRRRLEPRRPQDARRGHPPAPAARSRRQQGRHHRRAAEKIFIEFSHAKLATLGITPQQIFDSVARQNAVVSGGSVETSADRINLRVTGAFSGAEAIAAVPVQADGRVFRLGDIATVKRGYEDPPTFIVREGGKPAHRARRLDGGRRQHHHARREPRSRR